MATTYPPEFVVHDDLVKDLFGPTPRLELLHEDPDCPFAHEAGVFHAETNSLFVTSNHFHDPDSQARRVRISRVVLPDADASASASANADSDPDPARTRLLCEEIDAQHIPMANGAVNYNHGLLFCAQGDHHRPSSLVFMAARPPHATHPVLTSFYGRPFNSLNDVVVHSDGSIWFTDPIYGFDAGFRPLPRLPCQVYRYDPARRSVRAMADGFGRPNGICFSPDEKTVYVTDTDWIHGDGTTDDFRVSHIYAFSLTLHAHEPFLTDKRLFAMADSGIPDGIKCDVHGNVYSGCGDGVNIWSPGGVLLGKIVVPGGVANFCFGRDGAVYLLNEHRLWRAQLAGGTRGALLGI
ncbi:hypothetical protein E4U54_006614 [Claviceps lovelessii]|nr:hypothetical protein E4U54_006614 [Claviceps lovelessii]